MQMYDKDGVKIGLEIISKPELLAVLIKRFFKPEMIDQVEAYLQHSDEMFLTVYAGNSKDRSQIFIHCFHFCTEKPSRCFVVVVPADQLPVGERFLKLLKGELKREGEWDETTRFGLFDQDRNLLNLPIVPLK